MYEPTVPTINIDQVGTLGGLLRDRARRRPEQPFVTVEGQSYTFAQMDARSDELANGLRQLGVNAGDRVAWLSTNRGEVVELFFAIAKLGAVQVPLNAFLKGRLLSYQITHSQASVVVADGPGMECVDAVAPDLAEVRTFVRLDADALAPTNIPGGRLVDFSSIADPSSSPAEWPAVRPTDTFAIMYTSGTTGASKGCVLNHGYHIRDTLAFGQGIGLSPDDTLFTTLPLFHIAAIVSTLVSALVWEIHAVIDAQFSAGSFFDRAREVDATVSIAVAAMANALLTTPASDSDRDHKLRAMTIVPLTPEAQLAFEKRFGIEAWSEMYAQTECTPVTISPRLADNRDRAGAGAPMDDLDVELFDDDDQPVAEGEVGEIVLRPKSKFAMFNGYWNMPEETLEAFRGLWYHTGDLGRRLPSGQIAFVDRKKDAMRRRGENISSMEVEAIIARHEAVADVAVHAVPSPMGEDDVKACLVLKSGASITPEEMFDFFCAEMPFYMVPRYVQIIDDLPRTAIGRVQKYVLREHSLDGVWDFDALGLKLTADRRRGSGTRPVTAPTA
jgi:crotonobetaine/carnitine-CoA ligase